MNDWDGAEAFMSAPSRVEIDAPVRLHLGLIAMGNGGPRINGGLGFALEEPRLSITARKNRSIEIVDRRAGCLGRAEQEHLSALIRQLCVDAGFVHLPHVTIAGNAPSHVGFGAGTAIRLAALEATHILNDRHPSRAELIARSGRGGTWGVGVRTYFQGGITFDLGHRADGGQRPSHTWRTPRAPLELARLDMPDWSIGICLPPEVPPLTHDQERAVFTIATPVSRQEMQQTLYFALLGVFASAAEADLLTFVTSLEQLQSSAWKAAEWSAHGPALPQAATALQKSGACGIGLSSMGPALFFCAHNLRPQELPDALRKSVIITRPRNIGRQVLIHDLVEV
jgi:beta-ribofuranosylaminobenzene 5'-phosphate synthase